MTDDSLASDAEREQAVARLREASAEGRLTLDELFDRTDAAYAARTHGELVRVTDGLPAVGAARTGARVAAGFFAPARLDLRRSRATRVTVLALSGEPIRVRGLALFATVVVRAERS